MDVLLSVPLVSYLLAPALTSWSTSLNLLFFYMTWSTLVLSHSPLAVHMVGIVAIRLVFWLLPSLLSLLFDLALPSLAHDLKHGGRSSLPARHGAALARQLGLALFNLAAVTGVEAAASAAYTTAFGRPEFRTSTTLPLPWQMLKNIVTLLAAREALVYYIHRFVLHGDTPLAAPHRRFAHAVAGAPSCIQLFTDHPLPLVLHRLVPGYLPALVLRPHLLTYFVFVLFCTCEETLAMSGYTVVPGIMMSGACQRAAIHYANRGESNFGAWGLLDWAHGTSRGRDVLQDVRAEADKHNVKERSAQKVGDGADIVQEGMEALRSGAKSRSKGGKKQGK